MSDTFGAMYISGQQVDLPGQGDQVIGPFAIPCSGVQYTNPVALSAGTKTIPTIANAQGVLLIPPAAGTVAWSYKTIVSDTGTFGSQTLPTFLDFDPANYPSNLYLTSAGTVTIVVQFI